MWLYLIFHSFSRTRSNSTTFHDPYKLYHIIIYHPILTYHTGLQFADPSLQRLDIVRQSLQTIWVADAAAAYFGYIHHDVLGEGSNLLSNPFLPPLHYCQGPQQFVVDLCQLDNIGRGTLNVYANNILFSECCICIYLHITWQMITYHMTSIVFHYFQGCLFCTINEIVTFNSSL